MGHHAISEVTQETYKFSSRSKVIAIALFVVGVVLAAIGAGQVKEQMENPSAHHDESTESSEPAKNHVEEHHSTLWIADHEGGSAHQDDDALQEESHESKTDEHAEGHDKDNHEVGHTSAHATGGDHAGGHGAHAPKTWLHRVWANLLLNSYYFFLFGVGALFFLAVNHLANAGWSTLLKRIMEAVSVYILPGFILLWLVIYFGQHYIYEWVNYFESGTGDDAILESKSWLLNKGMLLAGIPIMVAVWVYIRQKLRKNSTNEDGQGGLTFFRSSNRWSAGFIFFFAFSFSAIAWLVIMSIDAHWYSTMFSVYNFAIMFVSSLSILMMFLLHLKSKGYMEMVSDEVVHDLGKFMFAFCVFWGYIFVGQWLLIWYANLPEETVYFSERLTTYFRPLFFTIIFMCFLIPFLTLMMRNAKRNPKVLIIAGAIILIGHWINCYVMIMPGVVGEYSGIGLLEIGTTMAFAGVFIYIVLNALSKAGLYAKNHPYILESANHDVGI